MRCMSLECESCNGDTTYYCDVHDVEYDDECVYCSTNEENEND